MLPVFGPQIGKDRDAHWPDWQIFANGSPVGIFDSLYSELSFLAKKHEKDLHDVMQRHQRLLGHEGLSGRSTPASPEEEKESDCWPTPLGQRGRLQPHAKGDDMPPLPVVPEDGSVQESVQQHKVVQDALRLSPVEGADSSNRGSLLSSVSSGEGVAMTESESNEIEAQSQKSSSFAKRLAAGRKSHRISGEVNVEDKNNDKLAKVIGAADAGWSDFVMGLLILLNALAMGLELECLGNQAGVTVGEPLRWDCGDMGVFLVLEHLFTWIFAAELILRIYFVRMAYFKDLVNLLDMLLVLLPMVDLYILTPLAGESPNLDILRLLRLGKLVRAVRLMRTLRLFQGLRLLVQACSSFLPSLAWSMALLAICMLMGSLVMGNLMQDFILDPGKDPDARIWVWTYYGTCYRAAYTMYEITFAGNWPTRARPVLEEVHHYYSIFFVVYVTFIVFAVIRIITAVFLRETLEAANNDAELIVQEKMRQKTKYVEKLEGIFEAMDESGDGLLSEDEMTELLLDRRVQAYLQSLDLDLAEGEALFQLLQNGEGMVTYDDFIDGVMRCKGPARSIDQICLQCDVKSVADSVKYLTRALEESHIIRQQGQRKRRKKKHHAKEEILLGGIGIRNSIQRRSRSSC